MDKKGQFVGYVLGMIFFLIVFFVAVFPNIVYPASQMAIQAGGFTGIEEFFLDNWGIWILIGAILGALAFTGR